MHAQGYRFVTAVVISLGSLSAEAKSTLEAKGVKAYAFAELLVLVSPSFDAMPLVKTAHRMHLKFNLSRDWAFCRVHIRTATEATGATES